MKCSLVWFKRDLRLDDHRPLRLAARQGPVLGVYLLEPELLEMPETHPRHLHFLLESLAELRDGLRERGSELFIRRGEAVRALDGLVRELAAAGVSVTGLFSHEETGLEVTYARDRRVKAWARTRDLPWRELPQFGVIRGLRDRDGWARRWAERMNEPPLSAPERLAGPLAPTPAGVAGAATPAGPSGGGPGVSAAGCEAGERSRDPAPGVLPTLDGWLATVDRSWPADRAFLEHQQAGGEAEGLRVLASFLDGRGTNYRAGMASPVTAWDDCSRLSPHLAYGTVSLRRVHHATRQAVSEARQRKRDGDPSLDRRWLPSLASFEKRLRWHCHFIQKLESEPALEFESMNRAYEGLRRREEEWTAVEQDRFQAWRRGRTGYPMVDACMRALDATGWINFRMRAMLVSFAAYHLWLDWRPVARELAGRFLDFEPGIHISQCQMQSGVTGINQLRIYSPTKQVRDHDPRGEFIRRWVPELARIPREYLPDPALMPDGVQRKRGCIIGRDYPAPVVEHRTAVREARERIGAVRNSAQAREMARQVYRRHGSRKRSARRRGLAGEATTGKPSPQLGLEL